MKTKKALVLYQGREKIKRREYIDRSEASKTFFNTIAGTLVKKHWGDRHGKCYQCNKVGWDEFHIIWECEGTENARKRVKLREIMELPNEGEVHIQNVREKLVDNENPRDKIIKIGHGIKEILYKWKLSRGLKFEDFAKMFQI